MTFNNLLAGWLVVGISVIIGEIVAKNFGPLPGVGAGLLAGILCVTAAVLFYRARWRKNAQRRRELREKYRGIYRVVELPPHESSIKKPEGAEIKIGDYGWEAAPLRDDGLTYLQGLSPQWRVVWYAGFQPDQIENVALKPRSQYDWDYTWMSNPPECPFPVQPRETPDMGLAIADRSASVRKK
jgi:hypothetical protein